jgi:hypothetical protein
LRTSSGPFDSAAERRYKTFLNCFVSNRSSLSMSECNN